MSGLGPRRPLYESLGGGYAERKCEHHAYPEYIPGVCSSPVLSPWRLKCPAELVLEDHDDPDAHGRAA